MPGLFDVRLKARSGAFLFAAGAVLGLLTIVLPHGGSVKELLLLALSAVAIGLSLYLYLRAASISEHELHGVVVVAAVLITAANYAVGASSLYPLLYSWAALYAFYFFPLYQAVAHLVVIAVLYAVLLATQDPMSPLIRWILAVGTPAVVGVLVSRVLDVVKREAGRATDHARALEESEARIRLILDNAPDAFISVAADGTVATWNAAAERMFGWTAEEAIGRSLRELVFPPEQLDAYDERRRGLLASEEEVTVLRIEVELQRRDGSRFPVEETITRVQVGDRQFLSAFVRDISERERRDEEREALLREQAARAEAERVAEMVRGPEPFIDAALDHRRIDDI